MIHILLLILKIIGIILLAALGLLLVIVLAVLFVPVRYRAKGSYHGQPVLSVRAGWLFRLLAFRVDYSSEGLACTFKVLGIRLWHNRNRDAAEDIEDGAETVPEDGEPAQYDKLQKDENNYLQARESGGDDGQEDGGRQEGDRRDAEAGNTDARGGSRRDAEAGNPGARGESRQDAEAGNPGAQGGSPQSADSQNRRRGIPSCLRCLVERAAHRIRLILENLKFSFKKMCDKLKGIREFTQDKRMWLEDEKNQKSLKLIYRQAMRLLAHLSPIKGRCAITFGFDDPYTTGQVLEAASLIYPFCHRQFSLYPVFDEKVLDAEGWLKGRIRLSLVLWLALRVLLDGHTRRMLRGFLK